MQSKNRPLTSDVWVVGRRIRRLGAGGGGGRNFLCNLYGSRHMSQKGSQSERPKTHIMLFKLQTRQACQ